MSQRFINDRRLAGDSGKLLNAVLEQIKSPLLHIANSAELANLDRRHASASLAAIESTTESTLRFIDNYLLSASLLNGQQTLELEPVSLSAVLNEAALSLGPAAREHDCELRLELSGKYGPVMANRKGLEAALSSLGLAFIESAAMEETSGRKRPLWLAAHASRGGIVAGVFSDINGLSPKNLETARALYGKARQPMAAIGRHGAGLFVADSILEAMSVRLRAAKHHKLNGLAATFQPSHQLSLV